LARSNQQPRKAVQLELAPRLTLSSLALTEFAPPFESIIACVPADDRNPSGLFSAGIQNLTALFF
jgi:hypothetical protein